MLVSRFTVILVLKIHFLRIHFQYFKKYPLTESNFIKCVYNSTAIKYIIEFCFIGMKHIIITKLSDGICVPEYKNNSELYNLYHKRFYDFKAL